MIAIPNRTIASATHQFVWAGTNQTVTCNATAMITAFAMVPSPGFSRSGTHNSKTIKLVKNVAKPIDTGN
jgi:hypothetical protein